MHVRTILTTLTLALAGAMTFAVPSARAGHVSCGAVLTQDTTLDNDLFCGGFEVIALIIGADHITVDLNGHTIEGDQGDDNHGILNDGHDGGEIKNGTIRNFERGIWFMNGANHNRLHGLIVRENGSDGITVDNSHNNRIEKCEVLLNCTGVVLSGSNNNRIKENNVTDNPCNGIVLESSKENRIERNDVTGGGVDGFSSGIVLHGSDANRIEANSVQGWQHGILLGFDSEENRIRENDLFNNFNGIFLSDADNNHIEGNKSSAIGDDGNNNFGIALTDGSEGNTVSRNTAAENLLGIFVELNSTGNRLQGNTALNNVGGVDLRDDNPDCDTNLWKNNTFATSSQECINGGVHQP